jgi:cytochrome c553
MEFTLKHMRTIFLFVTAVLATSQLNASDIQKGQALAKKCSVCHGRDGISKDPEVPNLAGQPEFYLRKSIEDFQKGLREDRRMTMMAKPLSKDDVADLAAWFSSIKFTVELPETK